MQTVGAQCKVAFIESPNYTHTRYISFGQYDEEKNCDEFGISDDDIFFYAFEGEKQLKQLMNDSDMDFKVLSYELLTR
jgi:hypothetical protein